MVTLGLIKTPPSSCTDTLRSEMRTKKARKNRPCESYNIPDANADFARFGISPQIASVSRSDSHYTLPRTESNNGNGSKPFRRARSTNPAAQKPWGKHNM
jgi:hypothetical protein